MIALYKLGFLAEAGLDEILLPAGADAPTWRLAVDFVVLAAWRETNWTTSHQVDLVAPRMTQRLRELFNHFSYGMGPPGTFSACSFSMLWFALTSGKELQARHIFSM